MIHKGYYIEETSTGSNVYASYDDWRDSREPVYVAGSLGEAEQWVDSQARPKPIDFSYEGDIATLYRGFMYVGRQPFDPEGKGGWVKAYRNLQCFNDGITSYESTHYHLVNEMIEDVNDRGEFTEEQLEELDKAGRVVSRQYKSFQEALGVPIYEVVEEPGEFFAQVPTRRAEPAGTCYEDAWRFLIKQEDGFLIHGSVQLTEEGRRVNHAWVELLTGQVWEPQTKSYYTIEDFRIFSPIEEYRYTPEEAAIMVAREGNFGPWTSEERARWLTR